MVKIGDETYKAAIAGPFIACSMTAEAWAAWQGIRYARELLCGANVTYRHYTDCAGLASAVRARKTKNKVSPFYKAVRVLLDETEGMDWQIAWKSRKHPDMKAPHQLAASVVDWD